MSFRTSHAVESSSSYSPQVCRQFTFSEIELATKNFDELLVIGHGGFGKVYRGTIAYGESLLDAAIKRLESGSSQGAVEFWAEVKMLSNLRHCHLVSLIGYCNEGQEMILVYEYMPNGTLADRLHKCRALLITWKRRLKICIGAARGLDYLHTSTGIKHGVIHRDVKNSNILLDVNWAAKISDFGLSKIGPTNQPSTYVNTLVRGTFGYLDPDYFQTGRLTRKSDVYAFGVVLFEVLCGKQAIDRSLDEEQWSLATWAQDSIKEGRLKQIVDSNLRWRISPKCLKEFALLAERCLHSRPKQRPTMAEVVVGLESILAFQERTDSQLLLMDSRFFGRRVPTYLFPSNWENSVKIAGGGTSLKSLDIYFYTVDEDLMVRRFDFDTIVYATENFSEANKLLPAMYKGRLQNGQAIAIAQYSKTRYKEYMNEASVLLKVVHKNAVQLLGYCIEGTNVYLLYDFAPYVTLDGLIFDPVFVLDWSTRYKIILGVAMVLVYLHKDAPIRIIHGDVKPVNILLDANFDPKLSGFGAARTIDDCFPTYMTPEHYMALYLSTKGDVFSFGELVLETVTVQRIFDLTRAANDNDLCFIEYVRRNWLERTLSNIIDPRIVVDSILLTKFIEIGLLCVQRDAAVRPTMEEVVDMLVDASSISLPMTEILAMMVNGEPSDLDSPVIEDYDAPLQLKRLYQSYTQDSILK